MDDLLKDLSPIILRKGKFILRSGVESENYLDIKKIYGYPSLLKEIVKRMHKQIDPKTTCVVGFGLGGSPLASALSYEYGYKLCGIRSKDKGYGLPDRIVYHSPDANDFLTIVDDVFTSGSSLKEVMEVLQATGAKIIGCNVIVDREEGDPTLLSTNFSSLFKLRDFLDFN